MGSLKITKETITINILSNALIDDYLEVTKRSGEKRIPRATRIP